MNLSLRNLFKYLALLARGIGVYPMIILFSYACVNGYNQELFNVQLLGIILAVIGGYLQVSVQSLLEKQLADKKWLVKCIVGLLYIMELLCILQYVNYYIQVETLIRFFICILYITLFGLSIKAYSVHYIDVLNINWLVTISGIYIIAMAMSHYSILGLMYIAIIASYLFLSNQQKLEQLLQSTRENTPMFKRIRRDNMKWVTIVILGIFIAYPCRKQIGYILWWVWCKILVVIKWIGYIILKMLERLLPETTEGGGLNMDNSMGGMPEPEANELINFLFWTIIILITIYIIIKNRKAIIEGLKSIIRKVHTLLTRLYHFLFGERIQEEVEERYYEDIIEDLRDGSILKLEKPSIITKRKWHKQVKQYIKSPTEVGQYRMGYKLLLQGIMLKGIEIEHSKTPREIMEEVEQRMGLPNIKEETKYYEDIRYGEKVSKLEEVLQLKEALQVLLEMIETNRLKELIKR